MPGLKTLMQHCDTTAVRDGNRLQVCADLAELMAKRSTSLLDMAIGQALGARVGWPSERLQALRQERDAMSQAMKPMAIATGTEWSCAQIERETRWALDRGQFGEIGAARMLIARTGQNVAALARQYNDDRAAASARAASSPASGVVALAP
jgi:predicted PhzF superfamily epimerase YddE/YHI9